MITVLVCIDWFHPAFKAGGPVQSIANLVNQYGGNQVHFNIICSNADLDGTLNKGVAFDEWVRHNERTRVWYSSKKSISGLKMILNTVDADVLVVIGIYSWYYNLLPLLMGKAPLKIISVRGMLHAGALSQKSLKKKIYLAIWQLAGFHRRYCFHATDMAEKAFIMQRFGKQAKVFIAGNIPRVFQLQPAALKKAGMLQMVSVALISAMKNIALVLEALKDCSSEIVYHIYGPVKDETYWQQCQAIIQLLPPNISVQYKKELLPIQIEAILKEYEVLIQPSKSENFGHAIAEALSAGKPVITSYNTPFNELEQNRAGINVAIDNTANLTRAIDFFAEMPAEEFARWNRGANVYAARRMDLNKLKA